MSFVSIQGDRFIDGQGRHLLVFAAEESRHNNIVVDMDEWR